MLLLRKGLFGDYYGDEINSSTPLNEAQMKVNVTYIYSFLKPLGWSVNAVSALVANMQAESSINPGRWESDNPNPEAYYNIHGRYPGYGIVQWTPHTKYFDWLRSVYGDSSDPSTMDHNLERIDYELQTGLQWIPTSRYPLSFKEFSVSTSHPAELAKAFLLNYERPADQSESVQNYRGVLAEVWYTYLTGVTPNPPEPVGKKKKGFNFVIFNRNRRIIQ